MRQLPKRVKRTLRELSARAHEEELRRALLPLAEAFRRWEAGQVSSGELSGMIHEFHHGPVRSLYFRYAHGEPAFAVASAVARGVIGREEVSAEVLELLASEISMCEGGE